MTGAPMVLAPGGGSGFGTAAPLRDLLAVPPQPGTRADHARLLRDRRLAELVTAAHMVDLLRAGRAVQRWSPARALDQIDGAEAWCNAIESAHQRYGLPQDLPSIGRIRGFAACLPPLRSLVAARDGGTDPSDPIAALRLAIALAAPMRAQAVTERAAWIAKVRAPVGEALLWHLDRATELLASLAKVFGLAFADIDRLTEPVARVRGIRFPLAMERDGEGSRIEFGRLFLLADEVTPADGRLPLVRIALPARDNRLDDSVRRGVVAGLEAFNRIRLHNGRGPMGLLAGFYDIGDPARDLMHGESQIEAPLMAATLSALSGKPHPAEVLVSGRLKVVDHRIAGVSGRVDAALSAGCRRFLLPRINRAEIARRASQTHDPAGVAHPDGFYWYTDAAGVTEGWRRLMATGPRPLPGWATAPRDRMPGLIRLAARLTRGTDDGTTARLDLSIQIGRKRLILPTGEVQLALSGLRIEVAHDGGRFEGKDLNFAPAAPGADPGPPPFLAGPAGVLDAAPQPDWRIEARRAGVEAAWEIEGRERGSVLDGRLSGQRFTRLAPNGSSPVIVRAILLPRFLMVEEAAGLLGPDDGRNKLLAVRLLLWKLLAGQLTPWVSRVAITPSDPA